MLLLSLHAGVCTEGQQAPCRTDRGSGHEQQHEPARGHGPSKLWDDLAPWNSRMQDLVQDLWSRSPFPSELAPGGDLHETDEAFTVVLDLPGVNQGDITIDISGRRVMVHGSGTAKDAKE